MISDDEYLERIVAGIQAVTTTGAEVIWNEKINDRQFDVVVRFKVGTLRYLVLVEVKNRTRPASAEDVDAFVTKARDQKANKSVFVTAAGFQSGAINIAKRHDIDLFTITFVESEVSLPEDAQMITVELQKPPPGSRPELSIGEPELVANTEHATLVYSDGKEVDIPSEQSQMNYYFEKTKLADGRSLDDLIQTAPLPVVALDETVAESITFDPPVHIEPPDSHFFPPGSISAIKFRLSGRYAHPIRGNMKVDPSLFTRPVVYTNVLTGETNRFTLDQLPLGVKRVSVGNFYFIYHPLAYCFCDSIQGDMVRWHLVESFQSGDIVTGTFTQKIEYSPGYMPVADKKILNRLQARLEEYLERSAIPHTGPTLRATLHKKPFSF